MTAGDPVLPWLPWYVLDWLNSPRVLAMRSTTRDAYFWLLNLQWRDESLPAKPGELATLLPRTVSHKAAVGLLAEFFPAGKDGRRRNGKLAELRREAVALVADRKAHGRNAALSRWRRTPRAMPEHVPEHFSGHTPSPSQVLTTPPTPSSEPKGLTPLGVSIDRHLSKARHG